jgi:predicted dithiol-disulfide oxidoreductase (DUF899 family)
MCASTWEQPKVVSPEQWLAARQDLLAKEKRLTRQRDALAAERRKLPWVKLEKEYLFDTPSGKMTLSQLFENRSQLIIYHFMFGPEWKEGCPGCSMIADHLDGSVTHLANRDLTLLAVSRAPLAKIQEFKQRMGWRFKWVSSFSSDFNHDFHVSSTKEELAKGEIYYNYKMQPLPSDERPGASVFYKNENGELFHTYSTYARGLEVGMGAYSYLDIVPKGRDEEGLPRKTAWLRHHDRYEQDYYADAGQQLKQAVRAAGL